MVRYQKRRNTRATRRKTRMARSRKQYYSRPNQIRQPVQYFTRSYYSPAHITIPTGGPAVGYSDNFLLSSMPDVSDFTSLYDQYQIKAIKYKLIPRISNAGPSGAVGNPSILGNIWSVIDYDDSNVPTSLTTLLQYQNLKRTQYHQTHSRYIAAPTVDIGAGTPLTSSVVKRRQWIDCSNINIQHYGIKLWVDGSLGSYPLSFDLHVKYYMAFKNVR